MPNICMAWTYIFAVQMSQITFFGCLESGNSQSRARHMLSTTVLTATRQRLSCSLVTAHHTVVLHGISMATDLHCLSLRFLLFPKRARYSKSLIALQHRLTAVLWRVLPWEMPHYSLCCDGGAAASPVSLNLGVSITQILSVTMVCGSYWASYMLALSFRAAMLAHPCTSTGYTAADL